MEPEKVFLEYIIKGIVDHPEFVVVERTVDSQGILLMLTVHPSDMPRIIGKGGRLIEKVIKPLMKLVGFKQSISVNVKLKEPVGGKREEEFRSIDQIVGKL
jgi:predicted RNA-binding protein YlqC (UPF0109 family)